jgi:hypothetical protein
VPKFITLTPEEIEGLDRRKRAVANLGPYIDYMRTLRPEEWGAIGLEGDESVRAVRRRITSAAQELGVTIRHKRTGKEDEERRVYFKLLPKRDDRRGRPRGRRRS